MRDLVYQYLYQAEAEGLRATVKRPQHASMIFHPGSVANATVPSDLTRVEIKDKAITYYSPAETEGPVYMAVSRAFDRGDMHHCDADKTPIRFTYQYEDHHPSLHFDPKDYAETHVHVTYNKKITPAELKCFVKQVRALQRAEGMCDKTKPSDCLIDSAHSKALKKSFEERLDSKHERLIRKRIDRKTDAVMHHIEAVKSQFLMAAGIGYSETILRRYVLPLLQSKGVSYKVAYAAVESAIAVLKSKIVGASAMVSSFLVNKALLLVLRQLRISQVNSERVASLGGAMMAVLSDPSSLVSIAGVATGTATGVAAAETTLRVLPSIPKLRGEGVSPDVVVDARLKEPQPEPVPAARNAAPTARRRRAR
ncbi:MAG: hypothetical protein P1U40_06950 [Coxiellaceae bacterium]|nr:hypothetical protein [Coxiellaceae bacterium]